MVDEMNKKQLLYHIETSRGKLENTISKLTHAQMLEANIIGE